MRIDWRKDGLELYDDLPAEPDWADPTHIPLMVAAVVARCGNTADCLSDDEFHRLCLAALDHMPDGRWLVEVAVEMMLYALAVAGGWTDWLYDRFTGRYPWEPPSE